MTISWLVFAVILLFCVYRGYRQGIFGVLSRLLGLVASYAVSILYYESAARLLQEHTAMQGMVAYVVGGISLFLVASMIFSGLFWLLQKFVFNRWKNSTFSVTSGAALGLALGVFWGLLAVFTVSYINDMLLQKEGGQQKQATKSAAEKNYIETLAHQFVGKIVEQIATKSAVEPTVAKLGVALVKEPQKVMQQLQSLSNNSEVKALFNNPQNQNVLRNADPDAIAQLPEFKKLIKNAEFKQLMSTAGIQSDNTAEYERQVAAQFGDVWQRLDAVKTNERVVEILSDDNFKQQLQSQNPAVLLSDQRFMELVNILFAVETDSKEPVNTQSDKKDNRNSQPSEKVIYEWTDAQGQKHFSDKEAQ